MADATPETKTRVELAWEKERAGMSLKYPPSFTSMADRNDDREASKIVKRIKVGRKSKWF